MIVLALLFFKYSDNFHCILVFTFNKKAFNAYAKQHCDNGFPTILLLPTITAFFPEILTPERLINSITPNGVHGFK